MKKNLKKNLFIFLSLLSLGYQNVFCGIRSTVVNLKSGNQMLINDDNIGTEKIIMKCGGLFTGNGYLEAPVINITTEKFDFRGVINCSEKCIITAKEAFNKSMFTRKGGGEFIIKIDPKLDLFALLEKRRVKITKKGDEFSFEWEGPFATDLVKSIKEGNLDTFMNLIENNPEKLKNKDDLTDFMIIAGLYNQFEMSKALIELGASVKKRTLKKDSEFPFIPKIIPTVDIRRGPFDRKKSTEPEPESKLMETPLLIAYELGNKDFFKMLLNQGADPNVKEKGAPILMIAARNNDLELVNSLLKTKGIDVDATEYSKKQNSLIIAAHFGYKDIVEALLKAGANKNQKDISNLKAINYASKSEIIDLLREKNSKQSQATKTQVKSQKKEATKVKKQPIKTKEKNPKPKIEKPSVSKQNPPKKNVKSKIKIRLLQDEVRANTEGKFATNLLNAIKNNDLDKFKTIIEKDFEKERDLEVLSGLMVMAGFQNMEMVKILIDLGADINKKHGDSIFPHDSRLNNDETPLWIALSYGKKEFFKTLLQAGADPNINCGENYLLTTAASINDIESIEALISSKKINTGTKDSDFNMKAALAIAVDNGNKEMAKKLIEAGANPLNVTYKRNSLITIAASKNDIEMLNLLLEFKNINLDAKAYDYNGETALAIAVNNGYKEIAEKLLKAGANPAINKIKIRLLKDEVRANTKGKFATNLLDAINDNDLDKFKTIIEKDFEKERDLEVLSGLMVMAGFQNMEMVKILIGLGADINKKHGDSIFSPDSRLNDDKTPLWIAFSYGKKEFFKTLLQAGADPNVTNKRNPLITVVAHDGDIDILNILLKAENINIDAKSYDYYEKTALMIAADCGYEEIVKALLEAGANKKIVDNGRKRAVDYASDNGHKEIVKLLRKGDSVWTRLKEWFGKIF